MTLLQMPAEITNMQQEMDYLYPYHQTNTFDNILLGIAFGVLITLYFVLRESNNKTSK